MFSHIPGLNFKYKNGIENKKILKHGNMCSLLATCHQILKAGIFERLTLYIQPKCLSIESF